MTDHDAALAPRLADAFPSPDPSPDWAAVRRDARRAKLRRATIAGLVLAAAIGALPALGLGGAIPWLESEDDTPDYGYTVGRVETEHGVVEFRATRGFHMGLSVWLDGKRKSFAAGPDDQLRRRPGPGKRYLGMFGGSVGPNLQFVFSPLAHEVASVDVLLADGATRPATVVPPPKAVRTDLRFYYLVLPRSARIAAVTARGPAGETLQQIRCCGVASTSRRYVSPP